MLYVVMFRSEKKTKLNLTGGTDIFKGYGRCSEAIKKSSGDTVGFSFFLT